MGVTRRIAEFGLVAVAATAVQACGSPYSFPIEGPEARSPIAAVLMVAWQWRNEPVPTTLYLNVSPTTPIDTMLFIDALPAEVSNLVLRRSSSPDPWSDISEDSLYSYHAYLVRQLTQNEVDSLITAGSITPTGCCPGSKHYGIGTAEYYHVRYQRCRGWPCSGRAWVEVRSTNNRFRGTIFTLAVE